MYRPCKYIKIVFNKAVYIYVGLVLNVEDANIDRVHY